MTTSAQPAGRILCRLLIATTTTLGGTPATAQEAPKGLHRSTLDVDTVQRTYSIFVPSSLARQAPLVLVLHGGSGGSGERIRGFVGLELEALAEAGGFLVAYPDGLDGNWNDCRAGASYTAKERNIDDPGFLGALIRRLADRFAVDTRRVYAIGYSNGGHLAYRMALEAPELIAGIAVFGANLPAVDGIDCVQTSGPISVMTVNGTADAINPFAGGEVSLPDGTRLGRVRSAAATLDYFGALAGHRGDPEGRVVVAPDDAVSTFVEQSGWREGGLAPVVTYIIHGGGHVIPSARARFPEYLGPVERRFDAIAEAVRFFGLVEDRTRSPSAGGTSDQRR
jgi:polyhydroxybutyrate depolymerase